MFVREKRIGRYTDVDLVETVRDDGRTKQRIIRNLGRKEDVERRCELDRLARSAARLAQRSMVLSRIDEAACRRSPAGASARHCCSTVCGATQGAARSWRNCLRIAASSFPSSEPSSAPSSIG
jgi:hypothetical protein